MAISTETIGRMLASARNYTSMFVGIVGGVGIMSVAQQKGLTDALSEIYNGVSMIVHGATNAWQILVVAFPFVTVIIAKFASRSASVPNQAAAVQAAVKDPNTTISIEAKASILDAAAEAAPLKEKIQLTDPTLAALVPSTKVVSAN